MKTVQMVQALGLLALTAATSCATPSYFGKNYSPTSNVDIYYDTKDIKKEYEVMGSTELAQGFSSTDVMQQKVIELGKARGADGVVMKLVEEVTGTANSNFGSVANGNKKNNTFNSGGITTNVKTKKVQATFVKYK